MNLMCIAWAGVRPSSVMKLAPGLNRRDPGSNIVIGALAFDEDCHYDARALSAMLMQLKRLTVKMPISEIADRNNRPAYAPAGIEPVIGHLKSNHSINRIFLKRLDGD